MHHVSHGTFASDTPQEVCLAYISEDKSGGGSHFCVTPVIRQSTGVIFKLRIVAMIVPLGILSGIDPSTPCFACSSGSSL